jgi:hypothetical protein
MDSEVTMGARMALLGFESPCQECTFRVEYSLKKN